MFNSRLLVSLAVRFIYAIAFILAEHLTHANKKGLHLQTCWRCFPRAAGRPISVHMCSRNNTHVYYTLSPSSILYYRVSDFDVPECTQARIHTHTNWSALRRPPVSRDVTCNRHALVSTRRHPDCCHYWTVTLWAIMCVLVALLTRIKAGCTIDVLFRLTTVRGVTGVMVDFFHLDCLLMIQFL